MNIVSGATGRLDGILSFQQLVQCVTIISGLIVLFFVPKLPSFGDDAGPIPVEQSQPASALKIDGEGKRFHGLHITGAPGDGVSVTGDNCEITDSVVEGSHGVGIRVTGHGTRIGNSLVVGPRGIAVSGDGSITIGRGPVTIIRDTAGFPDSTDTLSGQVLPPTPGMPPAWTAVYGKILGKPTILPTPHLPGGSVISPEAGKSP